MLFSVFATGYIQTDKLNSIKSLSINDFGVGTNLKQQPQEPEDEEEEEEEEEATTKAKCTEDMTFKLLQSVFNLQLQKAKKNLALPFSVAIPYDFLPHVTKYALCGGYDLVRYGLELQGTSVMGNLYIQ
jgi:hypothetical protein